MKAQFLIQITGYCTKQSAMFARLVNQVECDCLIKQRSQLQFWQKFFSPCDKHCKPYSLLRFTVVVPLSYLDQLKDCCMKILVVHKLGKMLQDQTLIQLRQKCLLVLNDPNLVLNHSSLSSFMPLYDRGCMNINDEHSIMTKSRQITSFC